MVSVMHARTTPVTPASDRIAYSIDEVAARFGVTKRHIFRLIQRGEMRRVKIGRKAMVLAEDLEAYIDRLRSAA